MKRFICFFVFLFAAALGRAEDSVPVVLSVSATYTRPNLDAGINIAIPGGGGHLDFGRNPATFGPAVITNTIPLVPGATYPLKVDLYTNPTSYVLQGTTWTHINTPTVYELSVSNLSITLTVPAGYIPVFDGIARRQKSFIIDPNAKTWQYVSVNLRIVPINNDLGIRAGMATPLNVEKTFWRISLGSLLNGNFAGWLSINNLTSSQPIGASFALDNVMCDASSSAVTIVYQKDAAGNVVIGTNGVAIIKQVHSPQVSIDIVSMTATSFEYKCYHPSLKSATPDAYGRFSFAGDPFAWYIGTIGANDATGVSISADFRDVTAASPSNNPVARTMVTSLRRTGTAPNETLSAISWYEAGSTPLVSEDRDYGDGTETISDLDYSSGAAVTSSIRVRTVANDLVTGETAGTSNPVSMAYTYNPSSLLLSTARDTKSGALTTYGYTALGLVNSETRAYKDTADKALISTTYVVDSFGDSTRPSQITRTVNGVMVAKSLFAYDDTFDPSTLVYTPESAPFNGHPVLGVFKAKRSDDQGLPGASALVSETKLFSENVGSFTGYRSDDFYSGQIYSTTLPNGRRDSYVQQRGTWNGTTFTPSANNGVDVGSASRIAVIRGISTIGASGTAALYSSYEGYPVDALYLIPGVSSMDVTIRDNYANVVRTESYIYSSSVWNLLSSTNSVYSLANQLISRTTSAGTVYSATYLGQRLQNETDEAGTYSSYLYDASDRVKTISRAGVTIGRTYDALNHLTSETVTGGAETISSSRLYDNAGRISSETSPGQGTVTHSYDPTTLTHTLTLPSTAQRIETRYLDGRIKSVTGSAVVAQYFDYGVDASTSEFTSVSIGSASSSRWVKTTVDHLGREKSSISPDPSVLNQTAGVGAGSVVTISKTYDGSGRLNSISRTGYATEYYSYDDYSQVNRVGLDVDNTSFGLVTASSDRIVDFNTSILQAGSDWWLVRTSTLYPIAGSATAVTASKTSQRLSGFAAGKINERQSIDIEGNTSTEITTLNAAAATVTVTTTLPGRANNAVKTYVNGLPTSFKDFDGLITSYGYDSLNRLHQTTDSRNNPTTIGYFSGTVLVHTVTDAANNPTTFGYDSSGRTIAILDAQNHSVYCDYTARSQIWHQWGSGSYPIAYTYDPTFASQTGMTTYRSTSPSSWTGTTWPTSLPISGDTTSWTFDTATGVLTSKNDAQSNQTSYTYNSFGQTATITSSRNITTHYAYDPRTAELTGISYDNYTDADPTRGTITTPSVGYTYTRLGQLSTVTDLSGTRTFGYNASTPWRKNSETLSAYFGSRTLTEIYESATNASNGTVLGRDVGFDLAYTGAELHQKFTVSNLGRIGGLNTKTGSGTAADFAYNYGTDGLYSGYTQGSFALASAYETARDLLSQVKGSWGGAIISQFDYIYNSIGQRQYSQQSGSAFTAYGSATFRASDYNARGELKTSAMYNGTAPSAITAPSASAELPGRRYEFRFDDIGNRTTVGETGLSTGPDEHYTPNSLNQYTSKENNFIRVQGTVAAGAKVAGISSDNKTVLFNTNGNTFGGDLVPASTNAASGTLTIYGSVSNGAHVSSVVTNWKIPAASQTFFYDKDGNLTDDGVRRYFYDAENRLVQVSDAATGQTVRFAYDYLNRRIQKNVTIGGSTTSTRFIYDGFNLAEEIDGVSLGLLRTYTWGLDGNGGLDRTGQAGGLAQFQDLVAGKTFLPTYDANGNVAALVNASSGAIEAIYEYSPAGELLRSEGSYASANHFRFATKYQDDEIGLIYFGQRYYSPTLGRFINRDPIEEGGGANLYSYGANDFVNAVDTLGLDANFFSPGGNGNSSINVFSDSGSGSLFISVSSPPVFWVDAPPSRQPATQPVKQVSATLSSHGVQGLVPAQRGVVSRGVAVGSLPDWGYTPPNGGGLAPGGGGGALNFVSGMGGTLSGAYYPPGTWGGRDFTDRITEGYARGYYEVAKLGLFELGVGPALGVLGRVGGRVFGRIASRFFGSAETALYYRWVSRASEIQTKVAMIRAQSLARLGGQPSIEIAAQAAENTGLRVAAGMGQNSAEATLVRTIARGEKIADIVGEGAQLTYTSGNEVALVKLASGERALVMGGPGGISFENMPISRLFGHSHPFDFPLTGPSSFDVNALLSLGQESSWLYEHGSLYKFGTKF